MTEQLVLHGISDVYAYVGANVRAQIRKWRSVLSDGDIEDLTQSVVLEVWRASERFEPGRQGEFARYARGVVAHACVSWYRQRFIDERYAKRYEPEVWARARQIRSPDSFNVVISDGADQRELIDVIADGERGGDPVELAVRAGAGDIAADCSVDLARILDARGRSRAQDLAGLAECGARRAARRDRRPRSAA